jgi:RNA polymerase sigma-70 factor (ECF subfamily)
MADVIASDTASGGQGFLYADNGSKSEPLAALIECSCERLRRLIRRMLHRQFPDLRRWEDTNDVLQQTMLRLCRSLTKLQPSTVREFHVLAARQIRWELTDLCRHHFGPQGFGANHESQYGAGPPSTLWNRGRDPGDRTSEPESLAEWAEFHEQVERLPEKEREVFDLLWYQQLSQDDAAEVVGVSVRTIKRRWQRAKLRLCRAFHGQPPG